MKILIFCSIFFAFIVFAQEKQGKDNKVTEKESSEMEEKVIDDMGTGEYLYMPRGRRDPFWDLLRGTDNSRLRREEKEGIAGLEIDQLELEGIVKKEGKYIALLKGPEGKPYDVVVGQSVYDGEIIKIDATNVVFKKILTIALGGTKEKTIIKSLNPEEEEKQK